MGLDLIALILDFDGSVDCELKDLVDAFGLLGAAFDVYGAHLTSDLLALLRRDGSETLCPEKLDAGPL